MLYGIFLIIVFVALIAIKAILERREHSHHQPDDGELLCALALERGCSAYEIFEVAGRAWSCSSDRIDHDFDIYLDTMEIPAYVRHFLRKVTTSYLKIKVSVPGKAQNGKKAEHTRSM